jgi:hypothetical protein
MVYDGVFNRFTRLRVATVEAISGWVGEWLERFDYRLQVYKAYFEDEPIADRAFHEQYLGERRPGRKDASRDGALCRRRQVFRRLGLSAHAEGLVDPVRQTRQGLSSLPSESIEKILSLNARKFFRIPSYSLTAG